METEVMVSDIGKIDKVRLSLSQPMQSEKPLSVSKRSTLADVISNLNAVSDRDKFRAAQTGNIINILLDLIESDEISHFEHLKSLNRKNLSKQSLSSPKNGLSSIDD
jgi:hypothetical protein